MSAVTVPWPAGVRSNEYDAPLPLKLPTDPLLVVMSPAVKPVTASSKVTVTGIGEALVGLAAAEVIDTVGGLGGSQVTVLSVLVDDALLLPAASWAPPTGSDAITVPADVMPVTATE